MYKLCIEDDEGQQTIVPIIRDEITIGRQEGNTIRLTERNVSRRHARLVRANGQFFVEDAGARYGILRNGEKIAQRTEFKEGDVFLIGDYRLTLQAEAAAKAERSGPNGAAGVPPNFGSVPVPGSPPRAGARADSPPARQEGTEIMPAMPAKLVIISSNFAGQEFPLMRKEMIIGRGEECDIIIDHRSVSQKHSKIVRENGSTYQIVDLNSKNGVRIGGEKYTHVHLKRGDVVELGHVKFRFVEPGENYVFVPQADDFDAPETTVGFGAGRGSKPSNMPKIVGGVVALLLIGGIAAAAISMSGKSTGEVKDPLATTQNNKPEGTKPVVEDVVASNPKVAEGINKAKEAFEKGDIQKAIGTLEALEYANPTASDNEVIGELLSKARREKTLEKSYILAKEQIERGDHLDGLKSIEQIPPHSVFAKLITEGKLKEQALDGMLAKAQLELDSGKEDDAQLMAKEVLSYDGEHAGAKSLLSKIAEGRRAVAKNDDRPEKTERTPKSSTKPKKEEPKAEEKYTSEDLEAMKTEANSKLFAGGEVNDAIDLCSTVLRNGGSKDCYRIIGIAYNKKGDQEKACKNLNRALKSNPPNPSAIQKFMTNINCE